MGSTPPPTIENAQKKVKKKTTSKLLDSGWTPPPLDNVRKEAAFF